MSVQVSLLVLQSGKVYMVIFPTPQGKSYFGMIVFTIRATCRMRPVWSCFAGTPAQCGFLNGVIQQENGSAYTVLASYVDSVHIGSTNVWVPRLRWEGDKLHLPALLFLEKFPTDPCFSNTDSSQYRLK